MMGDPSMAKKKARRAAGHLSGDWELESPVHHRCANAAGRSIERHQAQAARGAAAGEAAWKWIEAVRAIMSLASQLEAAASSRFVANIAGGR
jgi:hypothetical protein